jgi:hypothetical protein
MTRINLVNPSELTDKHLLAEYRELPRIFTAVRKLQDQGKTPSDISIPPQYKLGEGHVKFFYDKLGWLADRYGDLIAELINRDINVNYTLVESILGSYDSEISWGWKGDYSPTPEEVYTNMARLVERHFKI